MITVRRRSHRSTYTPATLPRTMLGRTPQTNMIVVASADPVIGRSRSASRCAGTQSPTNEDEPADPEQPEVAPCQEPEVAHGVTLRARRRAEHIERRTPGGPIVRRCPRRRQRPRKTTRKTTKKPGPAAPRGPEPLESAIDLADASVADLAMRVTKSGGATHAAFKDPYGGSPLPLASLPPARSKPRRSSAISRGCTPTGCPDAIGAVGIFLDPVIAVADKEGFGSPERPPSPRCREAARAAHRDRACRRRSADRVSHPRAEHGEGPQPARPQP